MKRLLNPRKTFPKEAPENKKSHSAEDKKDLAKNLVTNLEKEIERLRRQSETMQLRRSLALKDSVLTGQPVPPPKRTAELEDEDDRIIHTDDYRLQVIKNRPQNLAPDNMTYEDLEELRESHKEKLGELESEYSKTKGEYSAAKFSPEKMEGYEDLTYEELVRIRVPLFLFLLQNSLIGTT